MILRCAVCKIQITKPVQALEDKSLICHEDQKDFVPQSFYIIDGDEDFPNTLGKYILNLQDLTNVERHWDYKRLNGCCGLDGCDGINTVCINKHEIGTECSDCWMPHYINIAPENVEVLEK